MKASGHFPFKQIAGNTCKLCIKYRFLMLHSYKQVIYNTFDSKESTWLSKSDLRLTSGASTPAAFGNAAPTVLYILSFGRIGPAAAKSKKMHTNKFFPLGRLFNAKFTVHLDVALFHSLLLFWQPWAVGWAHPTNQWAGGWHSAIFKTRPSCYDIQACCGSMYIYICLYIHNV